MNGTLVGATVGAVEGRLVGTTAGAVDGTCVGATVCRVGCCVGVNTNVIERYTMEPQKAVTDRPSPVTKALVHDVPETG